MKSSSIDEGHPRAHEPYPPPNAPSHSAAGSASATRTCSSHPRGFTPVVAVIAVLSIDMSAGEATPRSTEAAGTLTTLVSATHITLAARRAMSTLDTLSGPPKLNVLRYVAPSPFARAPSRSSVARSR